MTWLGRFRLALLAFVALWCAAQLTAPFGWDQGIFAWVGDAILQGRMPYRDAWDIKGPLAFLPFAAAQALFGRTLWGIRLLDLVLLAAAAVALRVIIRSLGRPAAAEWAALGFVLWYASGSFWHTTQPDGWVAMVSALGFAPLFSRAVPPVRAVAGAGLAVGLGLLVKPLYGALAVVPIFYVLTIPGGGRGRAALAGAATAVVPVALVASWLWWQGAWSDLVEVHFRYNWSVYSGLVDTSLTMRLKTAFDYVFGPGALLPILPAVLVGGWRLWFDRRRDAWLLSGWVIASFLIVLIQGWFFTYQWLPALPPLVILGAVGFHALLAEDRARMPTAGRLFVTIALVILTSRLVAGPVFDVAHFMAYSVGLETEDAYYDHFGRGPGADRRAARHIRDRTNADDPVLVWGWNVAINYMSDRPSPSRFGYSLPLMMGPGSAYRSTYREELMAALRKHPPAYVVDAPQADLLMRGVFDMRDFPALHAYVERYYDVDREIGELTIYRRKGLEPRVTAGR